MRPKSELPEFNTPYLSSKTCNGLGNGMRYVTKILLEISEFLKQNKNHWSSGPVI